MMKYMMAVVSLTGLLAGEAVAADLAAAPYAPVPVSAAPWSGFHVGVVGGWGRGTASHDGLVTPLGNGSGDFTQSGWIAGGTVGYDWQFGMFDVGVEADISGASIDGNTSNGACGAAFPCRTKMGWLHTGRARLGVPIGQIMPYITGGIAATGLKVTNMFDSTNCEPSSMWGGVVGGGLEWLFLPNWSAKAEYLYIPTFGSKMPPDMAGVTLTERKVSLARFGINYHFGDWGSARY